MKPFVPLEVSHLISIQSLCLGSRDKLAIARSKALCRRSPMRSVGFSRRTDQYGAVTNAGLAIPSIAHYIGASPLYEWHQRQTLLPIPAAANAGPRCVPALMDDMRHTTAADAKGNRKMLIGALSLLVGRSGDGPAASSPPTCSDQIL